MIPPSVSPRPPLSRSPSGGFTMIEILTTVAIIGVLAVMLFPQVSKMQNSAKKTQCASNLREIGVGLMQYAGDNGGFLPPGPSWNKDIAPYFNIPVDSTGKPTSPSKVFQCPMDPKPLGEWQRTYAASRVEDGGDPKGVFSRNDVTQSFSLASIRYPSVTIMICEKYDAANRQFGAAFSHLDGWTGAATPTKLPNGKFLHDTGQNYLLCDGHVEFIPNSEVSVGPKHIPGWRAGRWGRGPAQ